MAPEDTVAGYLSALMNMHGWSSEDATRFLYSLPGGMANTALLDYQRYMASMLDAVTKFGNGIPFEDISGHRDTTQAQRDAILEAARGQIGTVYYENGGPRSSPTAGFDCSGLVWWAINAAGIPYDYRETAIMANSPSLRPLAPNEKMQAGDIMLYPKHVGFYDPNQVPDHPEYTLLSALSGDNTGKVMYGAPTWVNNGKFVPYRVMVQCQGWGCFLD